MNEHDWLAEQFEASRSHLRAVAYRMLGSLSEADDAVQESWLHLTRADTSGVVNLGGWLTTVVARICLDQLRARNSRREEPLEPPGAWGAEGSVSEPTPRPLTRSEDVSDPEDEVLLADAVGLALLVVLDTLNPAERLAFVLHDLFDVPFDEIAPIVGRSPTAARQLASRARRRVRGQGQEEQQRAGVSPRPNADRIRQRVVVDAFLAASRAGNFDALLALLDPDVVYRTDGSALAASAPAEVRGAHAVARQFAGRAQAAQPALVDGAVGLVWAPGGQPRVVFNFTMAGGKIVAIDMVADPARLEQLDVAVLTE